jgi:[acyl-carrier-protein] S-malonyltransferase
VQNEPLRGRKVKKGIAIVFPGQGSQYVGMGKEIFGASEPARNTFLQAADALGYDVADLCFHGPDTELNRTIRTQPCILTVSIALYRVLTGKGITPDAVAGHSLGEYSAIVAAGVIPFDEAVRLTEKRGQLMQDAVPEGKGLMAAVLGLERSKVDDICNALSSGYAAAANYNCPGQIVIAGEKAAVEEALQACREAGAKRAIPLAVSVPSHSRLMDEASRRLAGLLARMSVNDPKIPLVNNADARFLSGAEEIRESLTRQLNSPLLWEDSVKEMSAEGIDTFIEVGPGKVLSGLIRRIVPDARVFHVEDTKTLDSTISQVGAS